MSNYKPTKLCFGACGEFKPCDNMTYCKMHIFLFVDENDNERHLIPFGYNSLRCKRDNPNFKPLTVHEFIELYKMLPLHKRTVMSIAVLLEHMIIDGTVIIK